MRRYRHAERETKGAAAAAGPTAARRGAEHHAVSGHPHEEPKTNGTVTAAARLLCDAARSTTP